MPYRLVPKPLLKRIGRRGMVLILLGVAWATMGLALVLSGPRPHDGDYASEIPHENLPWPVLGLLWLGSGVVAFLVGLRDSRTHGTRDHAGFMAVTAPPILYAGSFLVSFVTYALSLGEHGWSLGILGFAVYGALALLIGVIAGWPEAPEGDA